MRVEPWKSRARGGVGVGVRRGMCDVTGGFRVGCGCGSRGSDGILGEHHVRPFSRSSLD